MPQNVSPTTDQGRKVLTYHEAGQQLGVCERTIWGLVRDGKLQAFKIGRSVRIPISELDRFIASQTQA